MTTTCYYTFDIAYEVEKTTVNIISFMKYPKLVERHRWCND